MKDPKQFHATSRGSKVKTLLLIRHAKSSWDDESVNDFERTLNDRGKKDAPAMAKRLVDKKIPIDTLISSPAKRAKKTATFFAEEYGIDKNNIIYKTELYAAPQTVFYDVIKKLDNSFNHIAIFSHNPGISEFANTLTEVTIDDMPTCSIFAIKLNIKDWNDFNDAEKEFWFFDYPKLIE
ncbi:MAG: putative phosphohistidine phosphatase, SixA [Chitinophagaceae bacterium]|nr:putative phosphohistidine phosphatase, SixA [Chitinophagaceae bacterium]